jgi:hypothetical protein
MSTMPVVTEAQEVALRRFLLLVELFVLASLSAALLALAVWWLIRGEFLLVAKSLLLMFVVGFAGQWLHRKMSLAQLIAGDHLQEAWREAGGHS